MRGWLSILFYFSISLCIFDALLYFNVINVERGIGSSMYPTLDGGDVLLCVKWFDYKVGDIVTFKAPSYAEFYADGERVHYITHRIIGKEGPCYITKGDNNPRPDPYCVRKEDIVCKVVLWT